MQVPSNLIIVRLGPRIWLGSLAICWGIIAALFAVMTSAAEFYALRIALGFAEAGTMPGMWYACSVFYQPDDLTSAWSLVLVGISASQIIGAPLASCEPPTLLLSVETSMLVMAPSQNTALTWSIPPMASRSLRSE